MMSTAVAMVTQDGEVMPIESVRAKLSVLRPIATPAEVISQQSEMKQYVKQTLVENRDFGVIPGVDKPSLLKPGAERCANGYGLYGRPRIVEKEIDHHIEIPWVKRKKEWKDKKWTGQWLEERGTSFGLYRYVVAVELVHRETGIVVAECLASCSSMESKYIDRPRDSENTIVKMAYKRAFVGAVLLGLGLSDEFTQDVEDTGVTSADPEAPKPRDEKCPVCAGKMWDNRTTKKSAKAPDFKCRDKACDGVIWKFKDEAPSPTADAPSTVSESSVPLHAADVVIPFGRNKGKKLGSLNDEQLQSLITWCMEKNDTNLDGLMGSARAVLADREKIGATVSEADDSDLNGSPFDDQ